MPSYAVPSVTTLVKTAPKKAVVSFAAFVSFAAIGAFNTASFVFDKTADLIAWATNDHRKDSWAPFLMAIFVLVSLARLVWVKLLQDQPANATNVQFTPEQLEEAIRSFSTVQHASISTPFQSVSKKSPDPITKPFSSDSDFAKNLKRAGANLFAQPSSSSTLSSTPPTSKSTPAASPGNLDDALLNETFEEIQNLSTKK